MNKKVILFVVIVATLVLTPLGVKKMIDNSIEDKRIELNDIGLSLEIENDKGYINSTRDFNLTIKDEKKFKEYFKKIFIELNSSTKVIFEQFSNEATKDFDEFLKGIVFKGNIKNSNINPYSDIEVYTYLHKLSDEIMNEIKKDKATSEAFLPLFEEESIALNLLLDYNSKLKTLALKDIAHSLKSSFKTGSSETSLDIQKLKLVNSSNQSRIIANLGLGMFKIEDKFTYKSIEANSKSFIEGLDYNIDYKNEFINTSDISVKRIIAQSGNKTGVKAGINIGESKISTSGNIINEIYSSKSNLNIKDFKFIDEKMKIDLDKVDLSVDLNDMDSKKIEKLSKTYINSFSESMNNVTLPRKERREKMRIATENLFNDLIPFINNGLSLKIDSNVEGLSLDAIKIDNAKLNVDALLNKNDINFQQLNRTPLALLKLLLINANLEMEEDDFVSLSKNINSGVSRMARRFVKNENGKAVFSLKLENGQLEINGNKVR